MPKPGEHLLGIAVRNEFGKIWTSRSGRVHADLLKLATGRHLEAGYWTTGRRFVTKETALELLKRQDEWTRAALERR